MEGMTQIDAGVLNVGYAEAGPTDWHQYCFATVPGGSRRVQDKVNRR
jgi:hypothetical protein